MSKLNSSPVVAAIGDRGNSEREHSHLRRLERVWIDEAIYFITSCTADRMPLLASDAVACVLVEEWQSAPEKHGWAVGRYVIMPDHVHFYCRAYPKAKHLSKFMQCWKQWTGERVRDVVAAIGDRGSVLSNGMAAIGDRGYNVSSKGNSFHLWQREFFDHVLRSHESYSQKWRYVVENPVRAGLVHRLEDWKYHGEIISLEMQ